MDDAWFERQLSRLRRPMTAWFALESVVLTECYYSQSYGTAASDAVRVYQDFLLGVSNWYALDTARDAVRGELWARPHTRTELVHYSLTAVYAMLDFDSPNQHIAAARLVRTIDLAAMVPLQSDEREAERQQHRIEAFLEVEHEPNVRAMLQEYGREREVRLLPMIADALQECGFAPPLG